MYRRKLISSSTSHYVNNILILDSMYQGSLAQLVAHSLHIKCARGRRFEPGVNQMFFPMLS